MYCALGEDEPLWDMDVGDGNGLSDLTQTQSLVLKSLGEVPSSLLAINLLFPSGISGVCGLVALALLHSAPSGTGWITLGVSMVAFEGTGMGIGMGTGTGRGTIMG